ncbi:dienelactone hydrolase family protein [Nocardioides sp. LHD-245]|uniref:dienelactone hydrolase family protein n=1 Tax=Nocardioides sp. LHD-245 TaxID=3051387 RepID=UPI0027DFF564|nr:dienelactone hydrolase family protein [Nocardioides sp. LHD-245]
MEFDVSVPRIEPVRSRAELRVGSVPTAEVRLFGLPRGAALLLCERGGLDTQAPELMNALAEHGYESLAVDLAELDLDDQGLLTAVHGLLGVLGEQGWSHDQIGVVGYGLGGRAALVAACDLVLGATVSLSPRAALEVDDPLVRSPWLAMFGEHDPDMPPAAVAELERRAAPAPEYAHLVVYPGVGADFFRASAGSLGHAAAFDSWQRVVEWLNIRVVPRPSPYAERWADRLQTSSAG